MLPVSPMYSVGEYKHLVVINAEYKHFSAVRTGELNASGYSESWVVSVSLSCVDTLHNFAMPTRVVVS